MRNLVLASTRHTRLPSSSSTARSTKLTSTVPDPDSGCTWLTKERTTPDADIEITILRIPDETGAPEDVAMFTTQAQGGPDTRKQVVSLTPLPDERKLVAVTRGGAIATLDLDDPQLPVEIVGDIDAGVAAAAWSPDGSVLALVTASATSDSTFVLMSSRFEVLTEGPTEREDFGTDTPINVGWGSKSTQFHGSLGKAAAAASSSSSTASSLSSPSDDGTPRIVWRSDGAYVAVSSLPPSPLSSATSRRTIRVFTRDGVLQSTSEPVPGLEGPLTWRGTSLLASTQRFGTGFGREGRHDVVFFERNGLRHGEFGLREDARAGSASEQAEYDVKAVTWNSSGDVLAVWISRADADTVQLWTTGNWHWYLKLEIASAGTGETRFTDIAWHPENGRMLHLTTASTLVEYTLALDTCAASADTGAVAVVDGSSVLLTPFRTQNVPPPMASHTLSLSSDLSLGPAPPRAVALASHRDILSVLADTGQVGIYELNTRLDGSRGKPVDPKLVRMVNFGRGAVWHVVDTWDGGSGALGLGENGADVLRWVADIVDIEGKEVPVQEVRLEGRGWAFVRGGLVCAVHKDGKVLELAPSTNTLHPIASFGRACERVERIPNSETGVLVGFARSGTLLAAAPRDYTTDLDVSASIGDPSTSVDEDYSALLLTLIVLATNATSFVCSADFVIYTTAAHEAHFVPTESLAVRLRDVKSEEVLDVKSADKQDSKPADKQDTTRTDVQDEAERRRIERGARIVVAVPAATALVLQMPRGNLETVHPRPMVMAVVRADTARGEYRKAFLACRKHRVDFVTLVRPDIGAFVRDVPAFVGQVGETEYLNLFLTSIGQSALLTEDVAAICDAVREELTRIDLKTYVSCVLTAHVVKRPPELEGALGVLLRLRGSDPALVEDAAKYVIFLVDANTLFDIALGMYDFELVLMIAQYTQKDPREYMPFLRELRALPQEYQRFRIDDHLRKHAPALAHIARAGPKYFNEALAYVERHRLHEDALAIWRGDERYPAVLTVYGEYLFERREFRQAAVAFVDAAQDNKALVAYEKALLWRELFDLAIRVNASSKTISDTAYRVADDLTGKKRYLEAGQVLLDYAKDTRAAVYALISGNEFSEARRVASLRMQLDLVDELVQPATLDARQQISDDLDEMREQLRKQVARIGELRRRKIEEPDAFYGIGDAPEMRDVDVMTDVSAFTAFTRYTSATALTSASSKRSSRSKRKMERKVGSGRKGTVDEEEYLLKAIGKIAAKFVTTLEETAALVPHLLQFTPEHRDEARALQEEVAAFEEEVKCALVEVWPTTPEQMEADEGGWARRMEEYAREREQAVKAVERPEMRADEWKVRLVQLSGIS